MPAEKEKPKAEAAAAKPVEEKKVGIIDGLDEFFKEAAEKEKPAAPEAKPAEAPPKKDDSKPDASKVIPDFDPEADEDKPKAAEDDEVPAEIKSEKAKADWKGLRDNARKNKEEAETLRKRVAELESSSNKEEVESLRTRLAEYEQQLTVVAVERDPRFQRYFDGKTKALIETAKSIGGDKVASILQLPESEHRNKMLEDAVADLPPLQQARIGAVLNDVESLHREKAAELARASDLYKTMQSNQAEQTKAAEQQRLRVLNDTIERWSDPERGSPLLRKTGDKDHDAEAERIKEQARAIYAGELDVRDMAKASLWAAKGPRLLQQVTTQAKRIKDLEAENESLKGAKPDIGSGGGSMGDVDEFAGKGLTDVALAQAFGR
jgi:hypothetical protein